MFLKKEEKSIIKVDINTESGLEKVMNTIYSDMTEDDKQLLSGLKIPVWELIIRNSGGHPSISNISGLNFLKYNKQMMKISYNTDKYVDVLKVIARELINTLKVKIDIANKGNKVEYDTRGVKLLGQDTNESFEYQLANKNGDIKTVTRDEFVNAGVNKEMRKSLMKIDNINKKIIGKFESLKINKNNENI